MTQTSLRVDLWADIICPWCYVGEARLVRAAAALGEDVEIVPHAFELDPGHSHPEPVLAMLAKKFGRTEEQAREMDSGVAELARAEGLPYTSDRITANTFAAHRLVAAGSDAGVGLAVLEALQRGHFGGDLDLNDADALTGAAARAGLDEGRAREVVAGDEYADAVREDQALARQLGVTGVPFTVVDQRFAVPGAASLAQYLHTMRTALEN